MFRQDSQTRLDVFYLPRSLHQRALDPVYLVWIRHVTSYWPFNKGKMRMARNTRTPKMLFFSCDLRCVSSSSMKYRSASRGLCGGQGPFTHPEKMPHFNPRLTLDFKPHKTASAASHKPIQGPVQNINPSHVQMVSILHPRSDLPLVIYCGVVVGGTRSAISDDE